MSASGGRRRNSGLTRREFLATAAAGAAAFSCSGPRAIEGSIVGGSHEHGHRLREPRIPAPTRTIRTDVAVFGGGIAGLSAAWRLRKRGVEELLVFELEPAAGGNSRWGESAVGAYPWGAHYVPLPTGKSAAVLELLEELRVITGTDAAGRPVFDDRHLCHAPQERLFIHGRWQEGLFPSTGASPDDLAQLRRFRDLMSRLRESGDFAIPVDLSKPDPTLDSMSMREWLDRERFASERLRWAVEYGMRDDYGCTLGTTSAWAGIHYFAARAEDQEVLTWPEGNGWIARRLSEPLGERLRTGSLVMGVREEAGGVEAVVLDVRTGEAARVQAKRAVVALPRFVATRVVEGLPPARGFTYAPWMTANLTVDRVPEGRGAPPAWDNVIYASPSLGYVTATHQSLARPLRGSVLTYYLPLTGDPATERGWMLARPWADWVETILRDLEPAHPDIRSLVSRCDVMLFGHGMIRPTPGFVWGENRRAALERRGRIAFAHSDMSGLSIFEEALERGARAADALE